MGIVPRNLSKEMRNKFNTIRKELFRTIFVFSTPDKTDCPNCLSDHSGASIGVFDSSFVSPTTIYGTVINPTSFTRSRCPVCNAVGYLENEAKTGIKALVRWNPTGEGARGDLVKTAAGIEGKNVVQVKTDKCYYEILRDAIKVEVDGVECEVLLPPVYRTVGDIEVTVIAYFVSVNVGHSIRD